MSSTFKWYPVVWAGFAIFLVIQLVFGEGLNENEGREANEKTATSRDRCKRRYLLETRSFDH